MAEKEPLKCLLDVKEVPMEEIASTGATKFWVEEQEYLYDEPVLFIRCGFNLLPLMQTSTLAAAVMFGLGFWHGFAADVKRLVRLGMRK